MQDGRPLSIDHYAGNTLLLERIKRGAHRVNVQKLKPEEDLSGEQQPDAACMRTHACMHICAFTQQMLKRNCQVSSSLIQYACARTHANTSVPTHNKA